MEDEEGNFETDDAEGVELKDGEEVSLLQTVLVLKWFWFNFVKMFKDGWENVISSEIFSSIN